MSQTIQSYSDIPSCRSISVCQGIGGVTGKVGLYDKSLKFAGSVEKLAKHYSIAGYNGGPTANAIKTARFGLGFFDPLNDVADLITAVQEGKCPAMPLLNGVAAALFPALVIDALAVNSLYAESSDCKKRVDELIRPIFDDTQASLQTITEDVDVSLINFKRIAEEAETKACTKILGIVEKILVISSIIFSAIAAAVGMALGIVVPIVATLTLLSVVLSITRLFRNEFIQFKDLVVHETLV
ncbi:MAG: hypothetical protein NTY13_05920 [Chlamydiae bacterium]|nr:hypothetical protein [Chlamydiota bacterium]